MSKEGTMKLSVKRSFFSEKEDTILEYKELSASLYKFETEVEAIRLKNNRGYLTVLPFKGHTIWDACFDGRPLNMHREGKIPPKLIDDYFLEASYGVFFFHCGALRMGCPAADDDHIMHGELPCAVYDDLDLVIGSDERGEFIGTTGTYRFNRGFGPIYEAHPITKLYSGLGTIEITMQIKNISNYPMELMYMGHVNFRPVHNAKIIQSHSWKPDEMVLRDYIPSHFKVPDNYAELTAKLKKDPSLTMIMEPDAVFIPEVGFYLNAPQTDENGWTHIMQLLPDGTADFLKYKPSELDHAMRWISRTADQQGLGLAFPSTANIGGYNEEKRLGNVKEIPPKGEYSATMIAGCLDKDAAVEESQLIDSIVA
jgi:hypothetical protein